MQYQKSAPAIFLSILILFSLSLFLYSCGVSNPTGSGGGQTDTAGLSALTAPVIQKAYVSGMKISVINTQTNTMINQIDLWGGFAAGMAINPKTNKLYATDINTNRLFVIDTNINFIVSISSVGLKPYGVTVNTLTNKIYVANSGNNTVSAINGSNNSIIATIPVGTQPERIAVDETTNTIYVANSMGNSVSIINGNTNQVTNTIAVAGKPMDVAVDPSITQAYVSTAGNITVIDTASQTLKTNISIPAGTPSLNRIAVNQITHQVYVSATNSLVVVDGSVNKVIGTTSNTAHVSNMALDDVTNKLYLDSWTYFGDGMTKTMSGDHKVNVADLSNMVITATSPSIPSALNILSTVIFSWTVPLQLNMILVDGDIVVVDTAPRTTTPPPPSNTPPPPKPTSLTIYPASATIYIHPKLPASGSQQYTAKDVNGTVVTNSVAWQSDKPAIAAINATGLAAPPQPIFTAKPGSAAITAMLTNVTSNKAELLVLCRDYTAYSQNDPRWDGVKYDHLIGRTIGSVGCALADMAAIISSSDYLQYQDTRPDTLNSYMITNGWYTNYINGTNSFLFGSIRWGVTDIYTNYKVINTFARGESVDPKTKKAVPLSNLLNPPIMLDKYLDKCQPVLVEVRFPPKPDGTLGNLHWVIVTHKQGNDYRIIDPWPNPAKVNDYLSAYGLEIYSYVVYKYSTL